jgi:hypothetical protein
MIQLEARRTVTMIQSVGRQKATAIALKDPLGPDLKPREGPTKER